MTTSPHFLHKIPIFSQLDEETLDLLYQRAITRQYQTDEVVAWENEEADGVSIVNSGWLKGIQATQTGRELVLRTFGPGDTFGMITALAHQPNQFRIVALENCEIEKIPASIMGNLIEENPAFSRYLIRYLSRNLSAMIALVEDLSLKSVESRLAKFILTRSENEIYTRKKWETQDFIAAQIGTVPDVLSRIMRKFEDEHIIHFDRQQIKILNQKGLRDKLED